MRRAATTQVKLTNWLKHDVFPAIGTMPISIIKAKDVLVAVQKMEARGAIESANKVKQLCGHVFRFGVASGLTDRDVTTDLKGALAAVPEAHYAAITEPMQVGALIRSIFAYTGHPASHNEPDDDTIFVDVKKIIGFSKKMRFPTPFSATETDGHSEDTLKALVGALCDLHWQSASLSLWKKQKCKVWEIASQVSLSCSGLTCSAVILYLSRAERQAARTLS